ncbi:MAG: hypothetical protein A4E49_01528 [Methanosaeta sp. PtaU1.Bin112]|nr:MAG: hypothetical protein A4E49_01528 [Methanosaeta sp. PtaU1.Bin112]
MINADCMADRAEELEAAANGIDPASLQAAKAAMNINCREYLRWVDLFSCRLETIEPEKLHHFARALSLTLLGHLPVRPATCPFCIQYGDDKSCKGCGYAATHGRCDADDSAFSLFIESFQELGRSIYQDTANEISDVSAKEAKRILSALLLSSKDLTRGFQEDLPSLSTLQLMRKKQNYIDHMILLLPLVLFSEDVRAMCRILDSRLKSYW